jgi:long-chain acyl-CoA synthetase
LRTRSGSIGRILPGQNVKLSHEGEILVKGTSVASEYWRETDADLKVDSGGWLHTGDIGEFDAEGNLFFRGRLKDVIVTSEGFNVYPSEVEAVLNRSSGVRESVVVARREGELESVHAVLLLAEAAGSVADIVQWANEQLESHQQIRSWSVWPEQDFPRTASTKKVRRHLVGEFVGRGSPFGRSSMPSQRKPLQELLSRKEPLVTRESDRLDEDLGLSSLDRVELFSRLEHLCGRPLDETAFANIKTVGQLESWLKTSSAADSPKVSSPATSFPRWARTAPVRGLRQILQAFLVLPLFRHFIRCEVIGQENLNLVEPPFILAANHTSHLDVPTLVSTVPQPFRRLLTPGVLREYFTAHFYPDRVSRTQFLRNSAEYILACLFFNTFPFSQDPAGIRASFQYVEELTSQGFCPVIFPEGARTPDGRILPLKPGLALLAQQLELSVVPIYLHGLFELMPMHSSWPRSGRAKVIFGTPLELESEATPEEATQTLAASLRQLRDQIEQ